MSDHERQLLTLEDCSHRDRILHIRCVFDILAPTPDPVFVTVWYDHDRQCGLGTVYTDNGEHLSKHIPFPAVDTLLRALDAHFKILQWARDYLEDTDNPEGLTFRNRRPIDWDTLAKNLRMDRREEAL